MIDTVVVATTVEPTDDAIVSESEHLMVPVFRGSERDVLDRYYQAAIAFEAEAVVRITSDCPLIEPAVVDHVIRVFIRGMADYASNSLVRTYPRGLDTEVMTLDALTRAWREAIEPYQRAHVTPYIYQNPELFHLLPVVGEDDYSNHRWTVDTPEDLEFVRAVYDRLGDTDFFGWRDVLRLLEENPDLNEINRHIPQKNLQEG
jgi:spore coat polysaccharide biosynthesis protein SpsF